MAQPQARSRRPLLFGALAAVTLYTLYHLSSTESAQSIRSTLLSTPSSTSSTFDLPVPPLEHGVDARLEWDNGPVPQTRIVRQANGALYMTTPRGYHIKVTMNGHRVEYYRPHVCCQ